MKGSPIRIEAIYEDEKIDTLGKPYSACFMAFSPHGGDDCVFGATTDVRTYWDSLTCSFDFNWFVFDTKAEMMEHVKEVGERYSGCLSVGFYKATDCELNEPPRGENRTNLECL